MKQTKILKGIKEEEVARYWDKNAKIWTCQVRRAKDVYREYFNNPAFLKFVGKIKGKRFWMQVVVRVIIQGFLLGWVRRLLELIFQRN